MGIEIDLLADRNLYNDQKSASMVGAESGFHRQRL